MYCLLIKIAEPHYKFPDIKVIIKHFETEQEANESLKYIIEDYIINTHNYFGYEEDNNNESLNQALHLFHNIKRLEKYIFHDSWMGCDPFNSQIFKI